MSADKNVFDSMDSRWTADFRPDFVLSEISILCRDFDSPKCGPESVFAMETMINSKAQFAVAATIAPEDLACGQMVAVLNETCECLPVACFDTTSVAVGEPVRIRFKSVDKGTPLKVKGICLPFVFLEDPWGEYVREDVRSTEFVQLDKDYARLVRKCLGKRRGKKKSSTQQLD